MKINIILKEELKKQIKAKSFVKKWKMLEKLSQPRMLTQEYEFVLSWYNTYKDQYDPVIITASNSNLDIIGILPLALSQSDKILTHAGADLSEYNGWLCHPDNETIFIVKSLIKVKQQLSFTDWEWKWLPPNSNNNWMESKELELHGIFINTVTCQSPIYRLNDIARINKLRKHRSLRSPMNRLNKEGTLRIESITDQEYAKIVFNKMENQSDFRKLALYNEIPSQTDPLRKKWLLSQIGTNDTIQLLVLWKGDHILACSLNYCSDEVVIGMLSSYDPVSSANAPGNIFLILLIYFLKEKGYKYLDLTPGGEVYKERFCNDYNTLSRPTICFSKYKYLKKKTKEKLKGGLKNNLKGIHIHRNITNIKSLTQKSFLTLFKNKVKYKLEGKDQLFLFDNQYNTKNIYTSYTVNIQNYTDIFLYKDTQRCLPITEVASNALRNFSHRDILYTIISKGELLLFAWLAVSGKKHNIETVHQCLSKSKNNYVICDIYLNSKCSNVKSVFLSFINSVSEKFKRNKYKKLYLLKPLRMDATLLLENGFTKDK